MLDHLGSRSPFFGLGWVGSATVEAKWMPCSILFVGKRNTWLRWWMELVAAASAVHVSELLLPENQTSQEVSACL